MTVIAAIGETHSTSPFGGIFDSFVSKFLIFACCIALFTATVIGGADYLHIRSLSLDQQTAKLRSDTELIVPQIDAAFDQLRNDVLTISRMPPFRGIARAALNGNLDPDDGSTTELWRARLETIFLSIMAHRPEYVQMRFIRIADGGRELGRVNRRGRRTAEMRDWLCCVRRASTALCSIFQCRAATGWMC